MVQLVLLVKWEKWEPLVLKDLAGPAAVKVPLGPLGRQVLLAPLDPAVTSAQQGWMANAVFKVQQVNRVLPAPQVKLDHRVI